MDCRTFRRLHTAYIDSELTAPDMAAVLSHILACDACATRDVVLRRGLMVARSLPRIRPSRSFGTRLRHRLAEERAKDAPLRLPAPMLPRAAEPLAQVAAHR